MKTPYKKHVKWIVPAVLICMAGGIWAVGSSDVLQMPHDLLGRDTHTAAFILLFVTLPVLGFPILPFMILLGLKFGVTVGTGMFFGGMAVHLAIAFPVSNSFLRPFLLRYACRRNIRIPRISGERMVAFSFAFMALPGLSYAMKNYLLPLAGVPFRHYFPITLLTQGILAIPFILAGDAAGAGKFFLPAAMLIFAAAVYLLIMWKKKKGASAGARE